MQDMVVAEADDKSDGHVAFGILAKTLIGEGTVDGIPNPLLNQWRQQDVGAGSGSRQGRVACPGVGLVPGEIDGGIVITVGRDRSAATVGERGNDDDKAQGCKSRFPRDLVPPSRTHLIHHSDEQQTHVIS